MLKVDEFSNFDATKFKKKHLSLFCTVGLEYVIYYVC